MYDEMTSEIGNMINLDKDNIYPIVLMFMEYKINGKFVRFYDNDTEIKKYKIKQGDKQHLAYYQDSMFFFTGSEIVVCETKNEIKTK